MFKLVCLWMQKSCKPVLCGGLISFGLTDRQTDRQTSPTHCLPVSGFILQNVKLPSLQPDCLSRLMLVWRTLVANFQEPEDESNEVEWVQAMVRFAKELASSVSQELALLTEGKKGKKESQDGKNADKSDIMDVIRKHADAIANVSSSRTLKMVIAEPKAGWDLPKLLVPDHLALGMFLLEKDGLLAEAKELKKLGDVKALLGKVPRLEWVISAMSTRLIDDENLKPVKTMCGIFLREFELAFISTMKAIQSSSLRELRAFLEKFKPIKDLCIDWSEKTEDVLTPLFEGKGAREDFTQINRCMEGLVADLNALKPFLSHVSSNETLKELISFGKEIYAQSVLAVAETKEAAGTILLAAYFVEKEDDAPTCKMAELVKFSGEAYSLKPEDLKGTFREMVAEAIAKEKLAESEGKGEKEGKNKLSQPKKREQQKEKDKSKKDKKQKAAKKDKKGK